MNLRQLNEEIERFLNEDIKTTTEKVTSELNRLGFNLISRGGGYNKFSDGRYRITILFYDDSFIITGNAPRGHVVGDVYINEPEFDSYFNKFKSHDEFLEYLKKKYLVKRINQKHSQPNIDYEEIEDILHYTNGRRDILIKNNDNTYAILNNKNKKKYASGNSREEVLKLYAEYFYKQHGTDLYGLLDEDWEDNGMIEDMQIYFEEVLRENGELDNEDIT